MEAASGEWIIFHGHPSWRSMLGFHLRGFVTAIAAGVAAGFVSVAITGHELPGWVVAGVLAVFAVVIPTGLARQRRTTYTITTERLLIELGLLGREIHETRLEQIQNVNASQSLLERALGVGSVTFDTAGGAAFEFSFRGVAQPRRIVSMVHAALRQNPDGPLQRDIAPRRRPPVAFLRG